MTEDPIGVGELFRKNVYDLAYKWAKKVDDALRDAVLKNECPQCHSGTHAEAMVLIENWKPFMPSMSKTSLICCVRCVDVCLAASNRST